MTITNYATTYLENLATVVVTSDLSGTIYYHWYRDGSYLGMTLSNERTVSIDAGEQTDIIAVDTNNAAFDPYALPPTGYPSRQTVTWTRSLDAEVVSYTVEQRQDGGAWSTVHSIPAQPGAWGYETITTPLDDLASYDWRITPVDVRGNSGTVTTTDSVLVVHGHNAPNITATLNGNTTVTVGEV